MDLTCNTEVVVKEEPSDVSGEVNKVLCYESCFFAGNIVNSSSYSLFMSTILPNQ